MKRDGDDPVRRRLGSLRCRCGAPATTVHLVDPHGPPGGLWSRGTTRQVTFPMGHGSRAMPACADHTHFGLGLRIEWLCAHWEPWLVCASMQAMQADRAVLSLLTAQEERRPAGPELLGPSAA